MFIEASQLESADFTLYLEAGEGAPELTTLTAEKQTGSEFEGDKLYYKLTAEQAKSLAAQTKGHLDFEGKSFEVYYEVIDDSYLGATHTDPVMSDTKVKKTDFTLTATPVTDKPELMIDGFDSEGTSSENTVTLSEAGKVTVNLNVSSPDDDGSEHVIRILIEDVPLGVTVDGAEIIGKNSWLLVYEGDDAKSIGESGRDIPVSFDVGGHVGSLEATNIKMTVQVQDRGNKTDPGTDILSDSVEWTLKTEFTGEGEGNGPATIDEWKYNGFKATEDNDDPFTLTDVLNGKVTAASEKPNTLTIKVTDVPDGTEIEGMTRTVIDGEAVWTASVTSEDGADSDAVQAALEGLMNSISMKPPKDWNDNNEPDGFPLNATLTTVVTGSANVNEKNVEKGVPVTPVTDEATVEITLGGDGEVDEADDNIRLKIKLSNPADEGFATIVDDKLYLKIDDPSEPTSPKVTYNGVEYEPKEVANIGDIPDGEYYVIEGVEWDVDLELVYTPVPGETPGKLTAGDVTVSAHIVNKETNAANEKTSSSKEATTITVAPVNDGVTVEMSEKFVGDEAADTSKDSLIELNGLTVGLKDTDGSEEIISILLADLPTGFLVFTGTSEAGATKAELSNNAGGNGDTNTWILPLDEGGDLPAYVGILPPQHWSGTLEDLKLIVTSGETSLSEKLTETIDLGDVTVTPVADGVLFEDNNTFGAENEIVPFNFNLSLVDSIDASVVGAADSSQETVTLELTGLGEFASFYVGNEQRTDGISYDNGVYTLTGLSQSDIDNLGFKQAKGEVAGTIDVTAWSVDGDSTTEEKPETAKITVNMFDQLATTDNDTLLWTGEEIDGLGGEDTVEFRNGESLTGGVLADQLSNIEILDLGVAGTNDVTELTADNVRDMTDTRNALTIRGIDEDSVTLSGDWRDDGDGVYLSGSGDSEVTLTVTDGVEVVAPEDGFAEPLSGIAPSGFGIQMFGLTSLGDADDSSDVPFSDRSGDGAPLTLGAVLTSDNSDDLSALLPDEDGGSQSSGGSAPVGPDASYGVVSSASSWQDDEQSEGMEYVS